MENNLNYKIIDNFLPKEDFEKLKTLLFSGDFPWFYVESLITNEQGQGTEEGFFQHSLYNRSRPTSDFYYEYAYPILKKLNSMAIIQIRANLLLNKERQYFSGFHIDNDFKCKTAVLYINTCNGYTILDPELKLKIKCEENKMLIFDSNIQHSIASQTDVKRRIVLNFNYF
jgi:hypothetical protein